MKRSLLFVVIWALCQPVAAQKQQVIAPVLPNLGITFQPKASVPEGFAERIMEVPLPSTEFRAEGLFSANVPARAYQVIYAKGGGIITVDRTMTPLSTKKHCRLTIKIESPESARIRHQIMIGTDLAEWEIVRRDPPSFDSQPFTRTYLLRRPMPHELRGIAFYEGTWAELECGLEGAEDSMHRLTWTLARRLRENHELHIAPIAETLDDAFPRRLAPTFLMLTHVQTSRRVSL
jgi:hypothetical protein